MEILLLKHERGFLYPADELEAEKIRKVRAGVLVRADVKQVRNAKFFRKFFKLLRVGFDAFTPIAEEYNGYPMQKDFEQFREDVIIAAGFHTASFSIDGRVRVRAKSISFAGMEEEEFERVYSQVADVLLQKVLANYSRDDLDNVVNQLMGMV